VPLSAVTTPQKPPLLGTRSSGALQMLMPEGKLPGEDSAPRRGSKTWLEDDCSSVGDLTASEDEDHEEPNGHTPPRPFSLKLSRDGKKRPGEESMPYKCIIRIRDAPPA
jgi:hypothetical protein